MQDMTRSLRYLFLLLFIGVSNIALAQAGGAITGTVVDSKKETVIGATVKVLEGGLLKGSTATDVDGNYTIKPLSAGKYDVEVTYTGYKTSRISGVLVSPDKTTGVNVTMEINSKELDEVVVTSYKVPLIDKYAPGTTTTITSEQIEKMATRSTNEIASTTVATRTDANGRLQIAGSRANGTVYIIDGMQVRSDRGVNLPQGMVDQVQVMTSGLSAKYGDAIGGVVALTTKGPSSTYRGSVTLEHSVDGYNHNLVNGTLSGPLYSKKVNGVKRPLIGFLVGGDFWYDEDRRPTYGGNYQLKDNVLKDLEQNPLRATPNQTGTVVFRPAAEYVRAEDMEIVKKRKDATAIDARINGKLDFVLSDNLNLTAGGSYNYNRQSNYSRFYQLFSPENQPKDKFYTARGYIRLTQKFGKQGVATDADKDKKPSVISNAYYTLQADYQKDYLKREDGDFQKDVFKYGYVGKFNTMTTSVFQPGGVDTATGKTGVILLTDRAANGVTFERSDLNPVLANYTSQYYNLLGEGALPQTVNTISAGGGLTNGLTPPYVYQLYGNVGQTYTGSTYNDQEQLGVAVDASFDLLLGKTKHAIEFGLYYQQRTERNFGATGASSNGGIWQQMRLLANRHISLDLSQPIFIVNGKRYTKADVDAGIVSPSPSDTIIYDRKADEAAQSTFDKNLRAKLGAGKTDYLNVDAYDPSTYSLSMFSADELLNSGNSLVGYYGYDYTGKKQKGQVNFNDFFTKKDANGNYTRDQGAYRPNYIAGYILDKFQFKDILFNVGMRIDRFDANTKVLKDPYSLYEVINKGDINKAPKSLSNSLNNGVTPSNIGNDYVVYVNNNQASTPTIIGYRNGDDWYDYAGRAIEDPNILKNYSGGRAPEPLLTKDGNVRISDTNFNPNNSFTDYKPQVNVMPRISFSFPVSDASQFYAHYDVIVQRPKSNLYATPSDYFFLTNSSNGLIYNPALKPEKLFDYEVGFQQQLSKESAIILTAFYKERKDMIQVRPYVLAYPQTYYTYGNRDFSTTKGLTLSYDLRRVGNLRMNIAYTLQFAEGTGSGPESGNGGSTTQVNGNGSLQNFLAAGLPNLRYTTALDYDSRHSIVVTADYRYNDGEGPVIGNTHFLQNAGLNLIFRTRSGEPYTKILRPKERTVQGELNGNRLPWHYGLDLRVDKDFKLQFSKKPVAEGAKVKRPLVVNAFCYVQNLLNIKDVLEVDGYTSRPDDDGWLSSPQGIQDIKNQSSQLSYIDIYTIYLRDPNKVNLPRRVNIGLSFNF